MLKVSILILSHLVPLVSYGNYELESILHKQAPEQQSSQESLPSSEVNKVEQEDIATINSSSGSIDDILRLETTATTARGPRSSGEAPQVRGLDDNKIFVMIDGSRQNFQSGHSSMVALDTENLKTVDVYKSCSSMAHSGSLGGGVNFITKDAKDILRTGKKFGSEFKIQHNSANHENMINGKTVFQKKNYSGYLSLSSAKARDLNLNNGETLDYSSYEDFAALTKIKYQNFDFKYEYFERNDNAPIDPTLNPPDSITSLFADNRTIKNNISLNYIKPKSFNALVYLNDYKSIKSRKDDDRVETRGMETLGLKFNKEYRNLRFGIESYRDKLRADIDGADIVSYPDAQGENHFVYIEKRIPVSKKFNLFPGLRQSSYHLSNSNDMPNKRESALSKKLKADYQVTSNLKTYMTYSEGFNAPRVNEVFPSGLHSKGDDFFIKDNFFIPNEDLDAETSQVYEAGFIYSKMVQSGEGLVEIDLNIYNNQVDDYILMERIDRSVVDEGVGTTQFVNISKVNLYGGEIDIKYLYDAYDLKLSYAQVRGRNRTEDIYLEDLPADHFNFHFKYYMDQHQLTLGYLGHYSLEQDRVNPETIQRTDETSSYFISNIFINKKINNFDINFRIDNLNNQKYRKHASHLYESERDFKLAIKYKINTI